MGALKWYNESTSSWEYVEQPGGSNSFVYNESISGADGSQTSFTTSKGYIAGSLQVFINGLAQGPGHVVETSPSGGTFSLDTAPLSGDVVTVNYQMGIPPHGNANTLDGNTLSTILEALYPVGSVFVSGSDTMPELIAGIGTWSRLNGVVVVGVDEGQSEFDTVDKTGGAKTHTLTESEMPRHNHSMSPLRSGTHNTGADSNWQTKSANSGSIISTGNTGDDQPHNNLQPYKTKFMWERIA